MEDRSQHFVAQTLCVFSKSLQGFTQSVPHLTSPHPKIFNLLLLSPSSSLCSKLSSLWFIHLTFCLLLVEGQVYAKHLAQYFKSMLVKTDTYATLHRKPSALVCVPCKMTSVGMLFICVPLCLILCLIQQVIHPSLSGGRRDGCTHILGS